MLTDGAEPRFARTSLQNRLHSEEGPPTPGADSYSHSMPGRASDGACERDHDSVVRERVELNKKYITFFSIEEVLELCYSKQLSTVSLVVNKIDILECLFASRSIRGGDSGGTKTNATAKSRLLGAAATHSSLDGLYTKAIAPTRVHMSKRRETGDLGLYSAVMRLCFWVCKSRRSCSPIGPESFLSECFRDSRSS